MGSILKYDNNQISKLYKENSYNKLAQILKRTYKDESKLSSDLADVDETIKIGEYTQEITSEYFEMPLKNAIEKIYLDQNLEISETKLRKILNQYLFTD